MLVCWFKLSDLNLLAICMLSIEICYSKQSLLCMYCIISVCGCVL